MNAMRSLCRGGAALALDVRVSAGECPLRASISLLVAVFALVASSLFAQGTTSRVVGVVSDASGAALPGAVVTLTNEGTGVSFSTPTSGAGTYAFEAVQVGAYRVTVEMPGFKRFVSGGNRVSIGEPTTVNARLELGELAETVEVTGSAEIVQTSSSGNFGSILEQRVVQDLPIVGTRGRNPLSLVTTQPGVVSGANTGGGVHVHGARDRSWNFTLDGIDTNESSAGGSNFSPLRSNPDSLAEFKVLTGNFTAEFGRNSGGQVAMITRSGTNDWKGNLFYFYRTPALNANEWENNINNVGKRQFVQHIPGFSLGGPIQKNKTFFFVNVQGLRALETRTVTRLVYTDQARRGIWRYVIGGRNLPAGTAGASVDASGNVIPGVNTGNYNIPGNDPLGLGLDPTTQALIGKTPLPNNFSVGDGLNVAGYTFTTPQREKQHDVVAKIDHVLNDRNHVFARVAFGRQDTICDRVNGGQPPFPGLPCLVDTERSPANVALNWRTLPRSNLTNELVLGWNHFTFDFVNPSADPGRMSFDFSGIGALDPRRITIPEDLSLGNLRTINTWQLVDNLTVASGVHTLKFGTNIRFQQHLDTRGSVAGFNVHPLTNFSTTVNTVDPLAFRIPGNINTANDLPVLQSHINFLLGRAGSISQGFVSLGDSYGPGGTPFEFDARYPELDFYAQDTWKPRRNLTLDFGLRWELKLAPSDANDQIARPTQPFTVGSPPSDQLRWQRGKLFEDDIDNLGAVVGFAWDPFGNGKTAVRGNYRLAFDRINTFVLSSTIYQSIPGITQGVINTEFGQGGGRLRNLPGLAPPAGNPADLLQPARVSNAGIHVVDPSFDAPWTHGWALSIQREIFERTVFEATYIGRRGQGLYGAYNVNQARILDNGFLDAFNAVKAGGDSALMNQLLAPDTRRQAGETGSQMVRRLFAPFLALNNVGGLAAALGTRVQGGRTLPELAGLGPFYFFAYPQFLGGLNVIDSNDWSRYNALELRLERRFHDGLSLLLAYTLAKSMDTRSYDPAFTVVSTGSAQSASSTPFDIFDRSLNFAPSDFDRRHVVQATWLWELPFGKGKRWLNREGLAGAVFGGWQVSGFLTWMSGRPFTVYSGSNTLTNVVQTPANCNGCSPSDGGLFDDPTTGLKFFFSPEERGRFGTPGPGEFSNVGRNAFTGPGSFSIDLAVLKRFDVRGDDRLELRADISNLTNTPTFGFPTATMTLATFGRVRDNVISASRKIQLGVKYTF